MTSILSLRWRNTIRIKEHFTDTTTPEIITNLCNIVINQLERVKITEEHGNLIDYDKDCVIDELETLIDNFQFLKSLSDGTIKEEEWDDYSFEGEYQDMFNGHLNELYDLGNMRVKLNTGIQEKFLWVD